tara:strand:+ start:647 stop:1174 length:528 start_codon:yes stop_codon:yes gene_type:complete
MADALNANNVFRVDASGQIYTDSVRVDGTTIKRDTSSGRLEVGQIGNGQIGDSFMTVLRGGLTAATGAAGALSLQNTSGAARIVKSTIVYVIAATGTAATFDVGIGSGASTSYDTIIDGANANAAGVYDYGKDKGTNGVGGSILWPNNEYITVTISAGPGSFSGMYIIDYTGIGY